MCVWLFLFNGYLIYIYYIYCFPSEAGSNATLFNYCFAFIFRFRSCFMEEVLSGLVGGESVLSAFFLVVLCFVSVLILIPLFVVFPVTAPPRGHDNNRAAMLQPLISMYYVAASCLRFLSTRTCFFSSDPSSFSSSRNEVLFRRWIAIIILFFFICIA